MGNQDKCGNCGKRPFFWADMAGLGKDSVTDMARLGSIGLMFGREGVGGGGGADQSPNCWGRMVIRLLPSHQVGYYLRCMRP